MATMQRAAYREVTGWPPWVLLLVWGCFVFGGGAVLMEAYQILTGTGGPDSGPREAMILLAVAGLCDLVPVLFHLLVGVLIDEVTQEEIVAKFGPLGLFKKRLPFDDIVSMEPVTYSPIREFGGWGIRFRGGGKSAWSTRGNRALVIGLKGGKKVYLGSERPEHLQSRIFAVVGRRYEWA